MKNLPVYCLHHAGGAGSAFRHWVEKAEFLGFDVRPVELPGRNARFVEPFLDSWSGAITDALSQTATDEPYAILGHSMGALLAVDVALAATADGRPPLWVAVAAAIPPTVSRPLLGASSDEQLLDSMRSLGGTDDELFEHPELASIALERYRADIRLCDQAIDHPRAVLTCPVHVLLGAEDSEVLAYDQNEWQRVTSGKVTTTVFPGTHFFLHDDIDGVLRVLLDESSTAAEPSIP